MVYVIVFLLGVFISWVSLLIVIPIAQKLADFSFPPWGEALWKLAVVAAAVNAVSVALDPVHWLASLLVGAVVFWTLMVKWFDVDLWGAIIIVVVSWIARNLVLGALMTAIVGFVARHAS